MEPKVMAVVVKVLCAADGTRTPHDNKYVVWWNPHTPAGVLELESTMIKGLARRFESVTEALTEWRTVSSVQTYRPWDTALNRPLTGVTVTIEPAD